MSNNTNLIDNEIDLIFNKGVESFYSKKLDKAEDYFYDILEEEFNLIKKYDFGPSFFLALINYIKEDYIEALSHINIYHINNEPTTHFYFVRGIILYKLYFYEIALEDFNLALKDLEFSLNVDGNDDDMEKVIKIITMKGNYALDWDINIKKLSNKELETKANKGDGLSINLFKIDFFNCAFQEIWWYAKEYKKFTEYRINEDKFKIDIENEIIKNNNLKSSFLKEPNCIICNKKFKGFLKYKYYSYKNSKQLCKDCLYFFYKMEKRSKNNILEDYSRFDYPSKYSHFKK